MRTFPYPDRGTPDLRSPARYLLWLARGQKATLGVAVLFGTLWMLAQAFVPFALGRAVDDGIVGGDFSALLTWAGVLAALTILQSASAAMRHRASVSNWLQATLRTTRLIGDKVSRSGASLPRRLSTGEVVATAATDAERIGEIYDVAARVFGSLVAYLAVSALVARTSALLGVVVLAGVPIAGAMLLFVIRPLQSRQRKQREAAGAMTAAGADTVAGLRVLRGIGGERIFVDRYRQRSQVTRLAGNRVASSLASLDAAQIFISGAFTVVFTWVGATLAMTGDIDPGQLVALFGYAVFLVSPIRTGADAVSRFIRAHVGARKVIAVLSTPSDVHDDGAVAAPGPDAVLHDAASGVSIPPGRLTGLVSADASVTADLAHRLGRFDDTTPDGDAAGIRWGDVGLREVPLEVIRRRIVVSEADPQLFTGSLREVLDPHGRHDDLQILQALQDAAADDVLEGAAGGLDHEVTERGLGFSGGQRQRIALARALLTDAPTLVLVEPTSAVDAHTESAIAGRLKAARLDDTDRTTVVVTASPLLLTAMDHVIFVPDGRLAAEGTHRDLMDTNPQYRRTVIRSE